MSESPHTAGVTVAPMTVEHAAGVLALGRRVYDTTVKPYTSWSLSAVARHLDGAGSTCRIALDRGHLAGFVLGSLGFDRRADWGLLEWIAVDPGHQGRGIARRLVEECCAGLFAAGAAAVVTEVESQNTASAALMRRNGFTEGAVVTLFVREPEEETARPPVHR